MKAIPAGRRDFPHAAVVLAASGACGALAGLALWSGQWAVEHAQIAAGLVTYPSTSPVAIVQAKLWSIVPQCSGLLLSLGVPDIVLSQLLSGLIGLVSFQALALVCYALGRRPGVAVAAPVVILVSRATDYADVYPIALLGTPHTYGALGLSLVVLTIGLIGIGWSRAGGFLLGLTPAVHLTLGAWAIGAVGVAALAGRDRGFRTPVRNGAGALLAGTALTLMSFAVHRWLSPVVAPIDTAAGDRILRGFVAAWDWHRQPVALISPGIAMTAATAVGSLVWLGRHRGEGPASSALMLRVAVASGIGSLALAVWSSVFFARLRTGCSSRCRDD